MFEKKEAGYEGPDMLELLVYDGKLNMESKQPWQGCYFKILPKISADANKTPLNLNLPVSPGYRQA